MPDYSKGKIYTIRNRNDDTLIYVGSTIQSLAVRWGGHKRCKNNVPLYQTINNDWTDWYIELYENYPCENREQLCKREGEVIREIGTLNKRIEGRTIKEYQQDNIDKIKEYKKKWREENIEKIKGKKKEYYQEKNEKIKEHQKEYYQENIEKIKEHKEQKKEYHKEYRKEYYQRKKLEKQNLQNAPE